MARKTDPELARLSAADALGRLERGEAKAADLVDACLDRIAAREPEVGAWAYLDRDHAIAQAEAADGRRASGLSPGPLHGLPVGVKDIIDTADMPTENGAALDAGRRPRTDAAVVERLRAAGAVIMGKTVTTELAFLTPAGTRNPHDPERTPGGSSSGSAAAVADFMVPLAVGSQTAGSVIRPASFCGVVGYKPSRGLIARAGVLPVAEPLDTMGVFARTVGDAAMLAQALCGPDPRDPAALVQPVPRLVAAAASGAPVKPLFAFVRQPAWEELAEDDMREAFAELAGFLGEQCDEVALPEPFAKGLDIHRTIMFAGLARHYAHYYNRGGDTLSAGARAAVEEGRTVLAHDYLVALDWVALLNAGLERIFERYDAIVTPAAPGQAPKDLATTGNAAFCSLWTMCGVPAVTLPLLEGYDGMPIGVQLIGPRGGDERLLRTARWLMEETARADGQEG
mgnify:CR=1 FL=1